MPGDRAARPRPARPRVPLRARRQRRPADPRRAGLGRPRRRAGRVTAPEPLFPRLDVEAARRTPADDAAGLRAEPPCPDAARSTATATSTPTASRTTPTRSSTAARLAGVERILVPGWNVASSERALALRRPVPLARRRGRRPSRTTPRRSTTAAGTGSSAGRPTRGSSRSARPGSTTTGSSARSPTSSTTCAATSTSRWTPASRPSSTAARRPGRRDAQDALLEELRRPGSAGRPGRRRSATGRRRSSTRSRGRPTTPATIVDLGLAISFSGLVFRRGEEASAEAVALVPADRLLVETDSPFLAPPGAPRSRNEPEWVRVTAAWAAEQRGDDDRGARGRPRRRLRPDVRRVRGGPHDPRDAAASPLVVPRLPRRVALAAAACTRATRASTAPVAPPRRRSAEPTVASRAPADRADPERVRAPPTSASASQRRPPARPRRRPDAPVRPPHRRHRHRRARRRTVIDLRVREQLAAGSGEPPMGSLDVAQAAVHRGGERRADRR